MTALDRAALAICLIRGKQWAALTATEQALYREDARAVLVALQEPTDEMIGAGENVIDYDGGLGGNAGVVYRMFRAMVVMAAQKGNQR